MDYCNFYAFTLQEAFKRATDFVISNIFTINQNDVLYLYDLHKQAVSRICNKPLPEFFNLKCTHNASLEDSLENMTKEEAMQIYIEKVSTLMPDWDSIALKDSNDKIHFGHASSTCLSTDPELAEESKTIFDFVKEGNLQRVKSLLKGHYSLKSLVDDEGLSLLHWACDRGYSEIAKFLIASSIDVNCKDHEGQTPLHYASSCGHKHVVNVLLQAGANASIFDLDGLKPSDVAYDDEVKKMLP